MEASMYRTVLSLVLSSVACNIYSKPVNYSDVFKLSERDPPILTFNRTPIHSQNCSENEEFVTCRSCEVSCNGQKESCPEVCKSGCLCRLFRNNDGKCVSYEDCWRRQGHDTVVVNMSPFLHSSIEECALDEVFSSCGWCEASCADPAPRCPPACIRGCLCRPPLLRHHSGHCVNEEDCAPRTCPNPNEEYVCKHGCEESCVWRPCTRQSRCRFGCHCRRGWLRNNRGACVRRDHCDKE